MKHLEVKQIIKQSNAPFAYAVNNLGSSQKNMLMIKAANEYVLQNPITNTCVFIENILPPCLHTKFPIYHITYSRSYDGTIISSDFKTFLANKKNTRSKHIYYMYDIEWKQQYHGEWNYDLAQFVNEIKDFKIATRTKDYQKIIKDELGLDASIINDFNTDQTLEMILDISK